jgi:hypothetical protein
MATPDHALERRAAQSDREAAPFVDRHGRLVEALGAIDE